MKRLNRIYTHLLAGVVFALASVACTDEINVSFDDEVSRPVTVSVDISLPEMKSVSRADMTEGLDSRVESLWIGIYNANTKERTGYVADPNYNLSPTHAAPTKVEIEAKSGPSYIVAVANYAGRKAHDGTKIDDFATILEDADSWEKFQQISAMFDGEGDINIDVPLGALLMSGHYIVGNHSNGDYKDLEPVSIATNGTVPSGAVHLRRLISQVRFNVTYNNANISDFDIISWSVKNVPNQSWVAERVDGNEAINVGDIRQVSSSSSYQNSAPLNLVTTTDNVISFDWWQLENKRTGRDNVTDYNHRETEYKDAAGQNTGKYTSLVESATSTDPNNNATFVELRVRMSLKVDEKGDPLANGAVRIVDGVYTVHLGYCEGTGAAKAQDFNCRRNSKYTYKVTINNVNDILVEARKEGEPTPGAEGLVSDVTSRYVTLDAHYGQYNIELTAEDLVDFHYMIRCYDGNGNIVDIDSREESTIPSENDKNRKYLDWVEIRKTTDYQTFSAYKPITDAETMNLEEFRAGTKTRAVGAGWYTIFFNEYVYETATDGNESGSTSWREYVNKPDRQVWFRVRVAESTDKESMHYESKYAFSQKSIQTYYDISPTGSATALGVEHTNESYGLNLRPTFTGNYSTGGWWPQTGNNLSENNGRFNVALYIANYTTGTADNFNFRDNTYTWNNRVSLTTPQTTNSINNQNVVKDAVTLDNPYPLPALANLTGLSSNTYDPDQSTNPKYIEAINACMNRNRDLDGDGFIDANELRWFVPTTNKYIRIILGRRSLTTPIMDYEANQDLPAYKHPNDNDGNNGEITSLILYGSNARMLWAMEGMSTSICLPSSEHQYTKGYPWNVRCVRNLGSDMTTVTSSDKVLPAYRIRPNATNIVELVYYDSNSIREEKLTKMEPHDVTNQDYNRCYKAFEYSDEISISSLNGYNTYNDDWADWLRKTNPCSLSVLDGTGWRVANQKEISIMYSLGISMGTTHSATYSHYDDTGKGATSSDVLTSVDNKFKIMSIWNGNNTQLEYNRGYVVRCIRDVD